MNPPAGDTETSHTFPGVQAIVTVPPGVLCTSIVGPEGTVVVDDRGGCVVGGEVDGGGDAGDDVGGVDVVEVEAGSVDVVVDEGSVMSGMEVSGIDGLGTSTVDGAAVGVVSGR